MCILKVRKIIMIHKDEQRKTLEFKIIKLPFKTNDFKNDTRPCNLQWLYKIYFIKLTKLRIIQNN